MIKHSTFGIFAMLISSVTTAQVFLPEKTSNVEFSSRDTNRIVCNDGDIAEVLFSEEKNLEVPIHGNSAYPKFKVLVMGNERIYSTEPTEFYVICANRTYTLMVTPSPHIEGVTIRLGDPKAQQRDHVSSIFTPMTIEERAIQAIQMVYKGEGDLLMKAPRNDAGNSKFKIGGGQVVLADSYRIDGFGLTIKELNVIAKEDIPNIQEINFLDPELSTSVIAITVDPHSIKSGEIARVFIVERESGYDDAN